MKPNILKNKTKTNGGSLFFNNPDDFLLRMKF